MLCSLSQTQEAGASLFKVRRCLAGTATFTIYTNSSRTTVLQVITIEEYPRKQEVSHKPPSRIAATGLLLGIVSP
jgi:hypothetical protein